MSYPYPDYLPLEEFKLVIDVIRSRAFRDRYPEFAQAIWTVQGYVQARVAPVGAKAAFVIRGQHLNDQQGVAILENVVGEAGTRDLADMVPWEQLLQWIAAKVLEALLHHFEA